MKLENIFEFNGKKYRLRELDLDLLHRASPLLIKYRELHYKYTRTIDTTKLDEEENEVLLLKNTIEEVNESDECSAQQLLKLNEKLKAAEERLRSPELTTTKQYVGDMEALALYEIITDATFMAKLLNDILISDSHEEKVNITESELKKPESLEFIKQVIASFFLLMPALCGK